MTDGIIQKAFREYLEHNVIIYHEELYNKSTKKLLFIIQQELIEEIKYSITIKDTPYSIQKKLIGEKE